MKPSFWPGLAWLMASGWAMYITKKFVGILMHTFNRDAFILIAFASHERAPCEAKATRTKACLTLC
jgi:hypothetical protein